MDRAVACFLLNTNVTGSNRRNSMEVNDLKPKWISLLQWYRQILISRSEQTTTYTLDSAISVFIT